MYYNILNQLDAVETLTCVTTKPYTYDSTPPKSVYKLLTQTVKRHTYFDPLMSDSISYYRNLVYKINEKR